MVLLPVIHCSLSWRMSEMIVKEIKKMAKEMGINGAKMLKGDLIRAIQSKEGNSPCYRTGIIDCPQTACCWWEDCQK